MVEKYKKNYKPIKIYKDKEHKEYESQIIQTKT